MAVLIVPCDQELKAIVAVVNSVRLSVADCDGAWIKCAVARTRPVPEGGVRVPSGRETSEAQDDQAVHAPSGEVLLRELSAAFWHIRNLPRDEKWRDERLFIIPAVVVERSSGGAEGDGDLECLASMLERIESAVKQLLQYRGDDEGEFGPGEEAPNPLAFRVRLCPWIFTSLVPKTMPKALFEPRGCVSDHLPLPIVHTAADAGAVRRRWDPEGQELLRNDLLWMLVDSMMKESLSDYPSLLQFGRDEHGDPIAVTTATSRLAFVAGQGAVSKAMERLVLDVPVISTLTAAAGDDDAGVSEVRRQAEFEKRLSTVLDVPDYPA